MFSEKVTKGLLEAGWYPSRRVDITESERLLKRLGYEEIPEVLKSFLREFGGLHIKVPYTRDYIKIWEVNLDVSELFRVSLSPPWTKEQIYEPRVGENLYYFGEIWNGYFNLTMAPSGKMYAVDMSVILFLGNHYVEMFENLFNNIRPPEVP